MTLVQLAIVFGKPISYFILEMTFLISISNIHNKCEEEALALFRDIEYAGGPQLALRLLPTFDDYFVDIQDEDRGISSEE